MVLGEEDGYYYAIGPARHERKAARHAWSSARTRMAGVVGLGIMGSSMAANLAWRLHVAGCDLVVQRRTARRRRGLAPASVAAVGDAASVIITAAVGGCLGCRAATVGGGRTWFAPYRHRDGTLPSPEEARTILARAGSSCSIAPGGTGSQARGTWSSTAARPGGVSAGGGGLQGFCGALLPGPFGAGSKIV